MRRLFALILAITLWIGFVPVAPAHAYNLKPCSESKEFAQRMKSSSSATASDRYELYTSAGLLCGEDGLPHLIVDGNIAHWGEFVIPSVLFLYIAGWIGWVGRAYLQAIKKGSNPEEKEIIIDLPLALQFMLLGFTWPLAAVGELTSGKLTAKASEITVSPR